jgi:photosystem II stability/assembly factor-like uncharacterized protein
MKTMTKFLPLLLLLISFSAFSQKSTKSNFNVKHLSYPKLDIASLAQTYSLTFGSEELKTLNSILKACTAEDLKALKAPNASGISSATNQVSAGYFNFPYLQNSPEVGELKIALNFGDFVITSKRPKTKKISTVVDGAKVKVNAFYYSIEHHVPLSLEVILGDKTLYSQQLGLNSLENKIGYDENLMKQADLDEFYDKNQADIEKALEITGTIISIHAARTALENNFFFVETEARDMIYSAKGKKLDYSAIENAQSEAQNGITAIDFYTKGTKTSELLSGAISTWEAELKQLDVTDKKARINKKIGAGLNYNLARAYYYLNDFDKSISHMNETISLLEGDKKMESIKKTMLIQKENSAGLTAEINKAAVISTSNSIMTKGDINAAAVYSVIYSKKDLFPAVIASTETAVINTTDDNTTADNTDENTKNDDANNEEDTPTEVIDFVQDLATAFANKETVKTIKLKKGTETSIPDEIITLTKLENLTMMQGQLNSINPLVYDMEGLLLLNFASNNITEIPPGISKLKNLQKFYISNNAIKDFPDELMTMTTLKVIMIGNVEVPSERIEALKKALPDCKVMYSGPNGNDIAFENATKIASTLGKSSLGTNMGFLEVQYFDAKNAIALGTTDWRISKTADGGKTWTTVAPTTPLNFAPGNFAKIHFLNQNEGWIVGKPGIFHTTDGGKTLVQQSELAAYSIHFMDEKRGVAEGEVDMYYTIDGGENWKTLVEKSDYQSYSNGYFLSENIIIVSGVSANKSCVYRVDISGDFPDFEMVYTDPEKKEWKKRYGEKIVFTDAETGFVIGTKGLLLKTADGGKTWTRFEDKKFDKMHFQDAAFANSNEGWIVGFNWETNASVVIRTGNAGKNWFSKLSKDTILRGLDGVEVVDTENVFFVGQALHKKD